MSVVNKQEYSGESVLAGRTKMSSDLNNLKSVVNSMLNKYEFEINEILSLRDREFTETMLAQRRELVQSLSLDVAQDLTILMRYKINNPSDYYLKMIEPATSYLRDVRQTIALFVSAEKL